MNFLSLFSGIGGLDLGLERAGMKCVAQVEIDPFCRRVLAKHWPDVPRFEDVRMVTREQLPDKIDLIAGGFPCQDISYAGKGAGIDGARSGLWSEFYRLTCEIRPHFSLVENVAALLGRGMGRIVGDLASFGYDAEWETLPACAFGAPHERSRVFIVAYPKRGRYTGRIFGFAEPPAEQFTTNRRTSLGTSLGETWETEPREGWLDDGIPAGMAEVYSRLLGNAVVPQVAEWIGRRIMEAASAGSEVA